VHSSLRLREYRLRSELEQNQRELEESNRKLKELDQIKGRFFANISHELRTPLTLLIAPLESLLRRFNLDAESKSMLATMHANGMRLLKLINDLLDLVRLESGRLELRTEPVDLAEFLKGLASAARQVADDKRLKLETHVDPALGVLLMDRDKLEKIVLNLVFNALKFTPSGGRVELRAEKQNECCVLTVTDTGMGISEQNLAHIFDRFWRADRVRSRGTGGAGLGLSIARWIVDQHSGSIQVQSKPNLGSTFQVSIPLANADTNVFRAY